MSEPDRRVSPRKVALISMTIIGWIVGLALVILGNRPDGQIPRVVINLLVYVEASFVVAAIAIGVSYLD